MSHVVKIELEIKDLDCLATACKELGLAYDKTETNWRWFGVWVDDYSAADAAYRQGIEPSRYGTSDAGVIKVPGAYYDIGVYEVPGKKGVYTLIYDNWCGGGGIEKALGKATPDLNQKYAAAVAMKRCRKMGFSVKQTESRDQNGRLKVKVIANKF